MTKLRNVPETKHRSVHLSKILDMKYTHITINVGATEKYYKAIWINPDEFKDVIIYLANFLVTVGLKRFYIRQECGQ